MDVDEIDERVDHSPLSSKELKKMRARLGWTQEELAERIGYSKKAVSRWENGDGLDGPAAALIRMYAEAAASNVTIKSVYARDVPAPLIEEAIDRILDGAKVEVEAAGMFDGDSYEVDGTTLEGERQEEIRHVLERTARRWGELSDEVYAISMKTGITFPDESEPDFGRWECDECGRPLDAYERALAKGRSGQGVGQWPGYCDGHVGAEANIRRLEERREDEDWSGDPGEGARRQWSIAWRVSQLASEWGLADVPIDDDRSDRWPAGRGHYAFEGLDGPVHVYVGSEVIAIVDECGHHVGETTARRESTLMHLQHPPA